MKKLSSEFVRTVKRHKILSVVGALVIIFLGWWAVISLAPHPLGDKLEYLGKKDYGCWIGFCDSRPASTYYYGTDMSPEEMKNIFSARYSPLENVAFKNARFTTADGEFMLTYEPSGSFSTSKKYVVSIVNSQYVIAKKYLKN